MQFRFHCYRTPDYAICFTLALTTSQSGHLIRLLAILNMRCLHDAYKEPTVFCCATQRIALDALTLNRVAAWRQVSVRL